MWSTPNDGPTIFRVVRTPLPTDSPSGVADSTASTATSAVVHDDAAGSYSNDESTAVIHLSFSGGYRAPVAGAPEIVITGDGQVFTTADTDRAADAGIMLTPTDIRTITPNGIEQLLGQAERAGLLAPVPPDYTSSEPLPHDGETVTLTITTTDGTFAHSAYALNTMVYSGLDTTESTPARVALRDFIIGLRHAVNVGTDDISGSDRYEPDWLWVHANAMPDVEYENPWAWPATISPRLSVAATEGCVRMSADDYQELLDTHPGATEAPSQFTAAGITYVVYATAVLPIDHVC